MQKGRTIDTGYEHGELLQSITVKAIYVRPNQCLVIDEQDNYILTVGMEDLESNKTFKLTNVIVEKRNNFCFKYALIPTKGTQTQKQKRNIKNQFKKEFQKFSEAKPGKVTNLKCMIVSKENDTLKLYDGQFFKMKLNEPIEFASDKLEMLFVKKSFAYNFVWETELTSLIETKDKDYNWDDLIIPEVKLHEDPNEIALNETGKWAAMLTTTTPPFTYSNYDSLFRFLAAAPTSPKKVRRIGEGKFKHDKSGEVFDGFRDEIRIDFTASNGKYTIPCVCFTKVATEILDVDVDHFVRLTDVDQRKKVKEALYEMKILTLKKQQNQATNRINFLILQAEDIVSHQKE